MAEMEKYPSSCDIREVLITVTPPSNCSTTNYMDVFSNENDSSRVYSKLCALLEYGSKVKIIVLVLVWTACSSMLMIKNEKVEDCHQLSIPKSNSRDYYIYEQFSTGQLRIEVQGALLPLYYANLSTHWLRIWVQLVYAQEEPEDLSGHITSSKILSVENVSDTWEIPIVSEKLIGVVPEVRHRKLFLLNNSHTDEPYKGSKRALRIKFQTNMRSNFPLSLVYNTQPISIRDGVIYAALVLIFLYILIIFEVVHRALAAMLASTMSVAILAALNARPTMAEIISWIDVDTLLLLFSMMTLVTILGETGIFDYLSVFAYKLTGGKIWPLVNTLCLFTAVMSCFLDNVTTALLMTPVTIRLCEVMKINPRPVLISMVIYSNLGGAFTPIGDPPNVIVASYPDVIKSGVTFFVFTIHMGIGTILAVAVTYGMLRIIYRDINSLKYPEPLSLQDLKREIAVWKRTAGSVSSYSRDEEVVKSSLKARTKTLQRKLKERKSNTDDNLETNYNINLEDLQKMYPIRDKVLLFKSGFTLIFVVCVFFLHSVPELSHLGIGWTALLGALLILLLSTRDNIETVLSRVEWSTLLFFASLFILMEALSRLGLIDWIGNQTQAVIKSVGAEYRLTVAIIIILWVSAIASAFVDNIPLTTMMIRVATTLVENYELGLPLQPLIWALSFGACFGGNGSLFGSSSNIICAGVAEQHGYRFTFMQFFVVGFPVMIATMVVTTLYLMVCHVIFKWH